MKYINLKKIENKNYCKPQSCNGVLDLQSIFICTFQLVKLSVFKIFP